MDSNESVSGTCSGDNGSGGCDVPFTISQTSDFPSSLPAGDSIDCGGKCRD